MDALADPSRSATVGKATALNWRSSEQTELDVPAAQAISVQPDDLAPVTGSGRGARGGPPDWQHPWISDADSRI